MHVHVHSLVGCTVRSFVQSFVESFFMSYSHRYWFKMVFTIFIPLTDPTWLLSCMCISSHFYFGNFSKCWCSFFFHFVFLYVHNYMSLVSFRIFAFSSRSFFVHTVFNRFAMLLPISLFTDSYLLASFVSLKFIYYDTFTMCVQCTHCIHEVHVRAFIVALKALKPEKFYHQQPLSGCIYAIFSVLMREWKWREWGMLWCRDEGGMSSSFGEGGGDGDGDEGRAVMLVNTYIRWKWICCWNFCSCDISIYGTLVSNSVRYGKICVAVLSF